jgi:hypothetical protein
VLIGSSERGVGAKEKTTARAELTIALSQRRRDGGLGHGANSNVAYSRPRPRIKNRHGPRGPRNLGSKRSVRTAWRNYPHETDLTPLGYELVEAPTVGQEVRNLAVLSFGR